MFHPQTPINSMKPINFIFSVAIWLTLNSAFGQQIKLDLSNNKSLKIDYPAGTFTIECQNYKSNNFEELFFYDADSIGTKLNKDDIDKLSGGNSDFSIEIVKNKLPKLDNKLIKNPIVLIKLKVKSENSAKIPVVTPPVPTVEFKLTGYPISDAMGYSSTITNEELKEKYGDGILNNSWIKLVLSKKATLNGENPKPNASSSSGFEAKALDALAKIIAERFKQELTIAYLNKFKAFIESKNENYLVDVLFPETNSILLQVDTKGFAYNSYLPTLRDAFHQDFQALPENSITFYATLKKEGKIPNINNNLYVSSLASLHTFKEFYRGKKTTEVFGSFDNPDYLVNSPDAEAKKALFALSVLSRSLQLDEDKWIEKEDAKKIFENEEKFYLFMGLMLEKEKKSFNRIEDNLYTKMNTWAVSIAQNQSKIDNTKEQIKLLINNFSSIASLVTALSETIKKDKTEGFNSIYEVVDKTISCTSNTWDLLRSWDIISTANDFKTKTLPIARASANLVKSVYDKHYGLALSNSLFIWSKFDENNNEASEFRKKLIEYGVFMYNVVNAENSEELANVLDAVILPPGSYAAKRNSIFNVSLNSFGGVFGGGERISVTENTKTIRQDKGSFAPSAPVGIYFGWGNICQKNNYGHSFGFMVPFIDLGAPFAFRLNDTKTEALPDFNLKNVIAPGIYGMWGIRKSPLSIGFGIQKSPELRGFKDEKADLGYLNAWRVGFKVAVDIPLFNIMTR